jgi:ssRNA-specific RNase YbeY (16S rRNA maturation enzyme)
LVILRKPVAQLNEAALVRFVTKACKAAKLKGSVNVVVTSSREMRSLNRRFRGQDKPTDVLSFPPTAEFANGLAGDVAISQDIAAKNAQVMVMRQRKKSRFWRCTVCCISPDMITRAMTVRWAAKKTAAS